MNIIRDFPDANDLRALGTEGMSTYVFEERLKNLRKRILAAHAMNEREIKVQFVYPEVRAFLEEEKHYTIDKQADDLYVISWDKNTR